jgi:hypothetical protein
MGLPGPFDRKIGPYAQTEPLDRTLMANAREDEFSLYRALRGRPGVAGARDPTTSKLKPVAKRVGAP